MLDREQLGLAEGGVARGALQQDLEDQVRMYEVLSVDLGLDVEGAADGSQLASGVLAARSGVLTRLTRRLEVLPAVQPRVSSSLRNDIVVRDRGLYRVRERHVLRPLLPRYLLGRPEQALPLELKDMRLRSWVKHLPNGNCALTREATVLDRPALGLRRVLAPRQGGRPERVRAPQLRRLVLRRTQPAAKRLLTICGLGRLVPSLLRMRQPLRRLIGS